MRKILYTIILITLGAFAPMSAFASTPIAEHSAQITNPDDYPILDNRATVLAHYLKRFHSPLVPYAKTIVDEADDNQIPWTWIAAISGVESTFGQHIPYNSYNGWGWAGGSFVFQDWNDAIAIVTKSLRQNYIDRGADTIDKIAPIYAPPSTTWALKVHHFIAEIEKVSDADISQLPISL